MLFFIKHAYKWELTFDQLSNFCLFKDVLLYTYITSACLCRVYHIEVHITGKLANPVKIYDQMQYQFYSVVNLTGQRREKTKYRGFFSLSRSRVRTPELQYLFSHVSFIPIYIFLIIQLCTVPATYILSIVVYNEKPPIEFYYEWHDCYIN